MIEKVTAEEVVFHCTAPSLSREQKDSTPCGEVNTFALTDVEVKEHEEQHLISLFLPPCKKCGTITVLNGTPPEHFTEDLKPHPGLDLSGGRHWSNVKDLIHTQAILAVIDNKDAKDVYLRYNLAV
jgi:hypothetical protein